MSGFLLALLMLAASPAEESFDVLSRRAAEARDAKRLDEALGLYRKALKLRPAWEEGRFEAGMLAYDLDKYAECAADFRKLVEARPDLTSAWTMAGLCEYRLRDYRAALKSLSQAERQGKPNELAPVARLHLALVLIKTGNYEKAVTLLVDLTRVEHKTPEIIVAAGIAGLRRPWTPPEVPESDRDLVYKLGDAMTSAMEKFGFATDHTAAIEKFELAARDYPKEPNVHFRFGAYLAFIDQPERGIQEIRKALELDPGHIPALVALSSIYLKRGEPQAARGYAEKAVTISPDDFAAHLMLGRALLPLGDAAAAVRELETSVRLGPENPDAHFSLADAYAQLGRTADASREREEFKRLRKLLDSKQP
jgi:tetratricopeptide (TPR) repeat protein